MPIISQIGRRSLKVRVLLGGIYVFLSAGAVTMLYPFALMIAGSTKSGVDATESRIVPGYLRSDKGLYAKHVEGLFNESMGMYRVAHCSDDVLFGNVGLPTNVNERLAGAWRGFVEQGSLSDYSFTLGYVRAITSRGVLPRVLRDFRRSLSRRYQGDIARMNGDMGTDFANWSAFCVIPEDYLPRRGKPGADRFQQEFVAFKRTRPLEERYYFSAEGFYKVLFLQTQYTKDIEAYNGSHGTSYASWDEVHLDRRVPGGPGRTDEERADWTEFVRTLLNLFWLRADAGAAPAYRAFLGAKYGSIENLNRNYGSQHVTFADVPLIEEPPMEGIRLSDWDAFLQGWRDPETGEMHQLPVEMVRVHSVDFMFRDHLKERFGTIGGVNEALGTSFKDWLDILPAQRDLHAVAFGAEKGRLRREFCVRNYIAVVDYIVLHGRSVVNTVLYCVLSMLAAIIINPIAAYALSRYKPPSTYKVLLFLMLTMSFPQMVTQIPSFLMLRQFGMLNTFWALILPGLANGYSIFLLKGFFDSLPRELYECAALDGAGEIRIFWQITMSLSKPILAVIVLNAFTMAYSNFMMALLICQDSRMWTLMPWLYQLQMRSGPGVIMASLIVAAAPTLAVFALCQNVIMRGIVVPVEK